MSRFLRRPWKARPVRRSIHRRPKTYPRRRSRCRRVGHHQLRHGAPLRKSLRADYDQSAIDAVNAWRWKPFLLNGNPTEVETTVTVTYSSGQ